MHYQIYLPGKRTGDGEYLEAAGLGHLRGGEEYWETSTGPDGTGGMIVTWPLDDPGYLFGYYPDEQEWLVGPNGKPKAESGWQQSKDLEPLSASGSPLYYCGFWGGRPPTPLELGKPPGVPGMEIMLGDGNRWVVPVAELLPKDVIFKAGSPQAVVKQQFEKFWDESTRWVGWFLEADPEREIPESFIPDLFEYVLRALSLNYRIVPELVTQLRLLDYQTIFASVAATLHKPAIDDVELEKKTADLVELAGIPAG